MPRRSIRLRLLLWFGLFLALLIAGFGTAVWRLQQATRLEEIDAELARRVDLVSRAFRAGDSGPPGHGRKSGPPPQDRDRSLDRRPRPPPQGHMRAPVQLPASVSGQFSAGSYFAVWGAQENQLLAQAGTEAAAVPRPDRDRAQTLLRLRTRGPLREAYQFTERDDCVLAGTDITPLLADLRLFAWQTGGLGLSVLLLGLGGGWLVSGLLLDSIRRIGGTARRIADGNLAERIPVRDMDRELGQLADVLNSTFARLEAAFERQRQFTADAAHELRTPLAVIISEAQTVLRRERSPGEYRDTIRACEQAAQRMRRLADSLLELARLDSACAQDPRTPADLARIAADCIAQVQPLAAERNIRIESDLQPGPLTGHPDRLARVFTNLIANALEYNRPGGRILVKTGTLAGEIIAVVADTGIGIAPEDLPHVFERFYRTAAARSGAEGHAGLGLAICKAIVEAHGGRMEAASTPGSGTSITVKFPASTAAA